MLSKSSPIWALALASSVALAAPLHNFFRRSPAGDEIGSLLNGASGDKTVSLSDSQQSQLNLGLAASLSNAAYCGNVRNGKWDCPTCDAVSDMQLLYNAGDGGNSPKVYVGWSPSLKYLIVSHEGTEANFDAWANDLDTAMADPDSSISNGNVNSGAQVHKGFQEAYLTTSQDVLSNVQKALSGTASEASLVLVTGHSLGAAVSTFTAINLKLNLDGKDIQMVGFGQPRVGNSAFADYYNSVLGNDHMRYTNKNDLVPHVPPQSFGFEHPDNEIWINDDGNVSLCAGTENPNCGDSYTGVDYSILAHLGPYKFGDTTVQMDSC